MAADNAGCQAARSFVPSLAVGNPTNPFKTGVWTLESCELRGGDLPDLGRVHSPATLELCLPMTN